MSLDNDLRSPDGKHVRETIEQQERFGRRRFLKTAALSTAGAFLVFTGLDAVLPKRIYAQSWNTLIEEDLTDNVFDKSNQYSIKIDTSGFSESGNTLYMAGPDPPSTSKFMTAEYNGQLREITDYNAVNLASSEWEGIHIGKHDNSSWVRIAFENAAGTKRYRFASNTAGQISKKPFNATQRFSLMAIRDGSSNVEVYVVEDFNPADPIENRSYQKLTGSTTLGGAIAGGVQCYRNGGPTFELTKFALQQPVTRVQSWILY